MLAGPCSIYIYIIILKFNSMNKNLQTTLFVIVFAIAFVIMMGTTSIAVTAQNSQKQTQQTFQAKLSGNNEVPPVTTSATGMAQFQLSTDGKALSYTLTANNIKDIKASHIHQGKTGENGQPVVPLSIENAKMDYGCQCMLPASGKGTITSNNLQGSMAGKQISDLVSIIKNGQAYVNIHTEQNKNGEIRGQILSVQESK
jgi:hypothetical protein